MQTITPLTTFVGLQSKLSSMAVSLRLDDAGDPTATQVINDASVEVFGYLGLMYSINQLSNSNWVELRTREIAAAYLCERRLNEMPSSAKRMYDRAVMLLERAQVGAIKIPDAKPHRGMVPKMVNMRIQSRPVPHPVAIRPTSSKIVQEVVIPQRNVDLLEDWLDFQI